MSYKLAQLFNAAYEYGGAKLLDYLQSAIGLTEAWVNNEKDLILITQLKYNTIVINIAHNIMKDIL